MVKTVIPLLKTQAVRLALTIPKMAQPADGFPLTIFMHGSGGNAQAIDRSPLPEVPNEERPDYELEDPPNGNVAASPL